VEILFGMAEGGRWAARKNTQTPKSKQGKKAWKPEAGGCERGKDGGGGSLCFEKKKLAPGSRNFKFQTLLEKRLGRKTRACSQRMGGRTGAGSLGRGGVQLARETEERKVILPPWGKKTITCPVLGMV